MQAKRFKQTKMLFINFCFVVYLNFLVLCFKILILFSFCLKVTMFEFQRESLNTTKLYLVIKVILKQKNNDFVLRKKNKQNFNLLSMNLHVI